MNDTGTRKMKERTKGKRGIMQEREEGGGGGGIGGGGGGNQIAHKVVRNVN